MKKVIVVASIIVAVLIVVAVIGNIAFEYRGSLIVLPGDPFWEATKEYDVVIGSILDPLYPDSDTSPPGRAPNSAAIVQYFLNNDFTNQFNELEEVYQKAIQGNKDSFDQRKKARGIRTSVLLGIKKSLDTAQTGMEIVRNHADDDEMIFTEDEDIALFLFIIQGSIRRA